MKEDVLLKISDIVEEEGAEFAFPTQTLHVFDETLPKVNTAEPQIPENVSPQS